MAYVDVDKFADAICNFSAIDEHSANAVILLLRRQPTADVVEVVRCKDCKKWTSQHTCDEFTADRLPLRGKTTFITEPDDFCSYGERKDT